LTSIQRDARGQTVRWCMVGGRRARQSLRQPYRRAGRPAGRHLTELEEELGRITGLTPVPPSRCR